MEISIAGIEEAMAGLGYRETSPKARLIRTIHAIYQNSTSTDAVRTIDSDELIDRMWNLEGDRRAIRSRRKNLSSIKSSVNQDLDTAWGEGRNPEGITIGPQNTFVMSDAAKDKILSSFSGSIGLDDGKTLDRVAEALKIVSDYLSEMPADVDGEQLSNLKTLIEDLSGKVREDGEGGVRVIEKIVYRDGSESGETGPAEDETSLGAEQLETGEGEREGEDVEFVDEIDIPEEVEEIEEGLEEADELVEVIESEEVGGDDELEIEEAGELAEVDEEEIGEEEAEDFIEVEKEGEAEGEGEIGTEGGDGEEVAELEDELGIGPEDEIEWVDEADLGEEIEEDLEEDGDLVEVIESDEDEGGGDDEIEFVDGDDVEVVYEDDVDEIEYEVETLNDSEEMESEDDVEDGERDGGAFGEDENVVELMGAEGLEDADEVEIVYEDEADDVEEAETDDEIDKSVEDEADEVELIDEDDVIEEEMDESDETMADIEVDDAAGVESEELEFVEEDDLTADIKEDSDEIEEAAIDEAEMEDAEEIEWVDEDGVMDVPDDFEEVFEDEADDLEEILEDDAELEDIGGEGDEDVVELVGAEGLEETDEVELVDEDDLIEEDDDLDDVEEAVEEVEDALDDEMEIVEKEVEEVEEPEGDEKMSPEDSLGNDIGLPFDQLMEDLQNFDEFQQDEKQKRLLAERFDGYLGAMERYYNQYILIKKGNYQVGADAAEEDVMKRKPVLLADYYMGKYPVTNALFEVFVERTGYKTTAEKFGYGYVYHGRFRKVVDPNTGFTSSIWNSTYTREKVNGATWYQPLGPGSTLHKKRNHPVVQVSIRDARTFAAWTGKRLPSEIEWEAAARSRTGFRYPWGNEWIEGFCNFENSGISDTCPVDHFPHSTNEAGLADLLGNVMEWTSEECEPKYPLETPARFFIAKGGSWVSPEQTTLFSRSRLDADFTSNTLGFRCLAD